jgi:hypothetical protein
MDDSDRLSRTANVCRVRTQAAYSSTKHENSLPYGQEQPIFHGLVTIDFRAAYPCAATVPVIR